MKRYITINSITGSELFDYDNVFKQSFDDVESIVDKSHFMPHSSVLSALENGYSSNSNLGSYDDPKTLASGTIPINRRHGQTITEIYCESQTLTSRLKEKAADFARKRRDEEIIKKAFSANTKKSSTDTSTSQE